MSKFKSGDKVRKIVGYPFSGIVCAVYDDQPKCNVKHKDQWEHIFSDKQLVYDHPEYQYLDLVKDILENGSYRDGRNGGTYSLFGRQIRFNLEEGFPLLTTKKLHWKSIAGELLWFLSGSTNNNDLEKNGVTIWREWVKDGNQLPLIYPYQWRKWDDSGNWKKHVVEIPILGDRYGNNKDFHTDIPLKQPEISDTDDLVGTVINTNSSGPIRIIRKIGVIKGNSHYEIQYLEGIRYIDVKSRPNILNGMCKNPYSPLPNIPSAIKGVVKEKPIYYIKAYSLWRNMMFRCHGTNYTPCQEYYKNDGIFVDMDWRCFENFLADLPGIPGFHNWVSAPDMYSLDKDYFCASYYGKYSTIFIPNVYNSCHLPQMDGSKIVATSMINGEAFEFTSPSFFIENYALKDKDIVNRAFRLQNGKTKKWNFEKIHPKEGFVFRQRFFIDQISLLIENIKDDPYSRRHIISAWNVAQIDKMALPPCHCLFQFFVDNGKLSCHLYQRSCDIGLGLPYNIASYALLTHLIARETGLKVADLVISFGDIHVYENHVEALKTQLERQPMPFPHLYIPSDKGIFDLTFPDIQLRHYEAHPHIKMEVSA